MWPDAELRPGRSALATGIFSALQSGAADAAFVVGENTILHCVEFEPPESGDRFTITEVAAVLVPTEFFQGELNYDDLWEILSVHRRDLPPLAESILAPLHEPAIGRFEESLGIGGYFTPAVPSRRLVQLLGGENGIDRICWRDGRRWDTWTPGPALAHGVATVIGTSRLAQMSGYRLVWVVFRNDRLVFLVDPQRNQIRRFRNDEANADGHA